MGSFSRVYEKEPDVQLQDEMEKDNTIPVDEQRDLERSRDFAKDNKWTFKTSEFLHQKNDERINWVSDIKSQVLYQKNDKTINWVSEKEYMHEKPATSTKKHKVQSLENPRRFHEHENVVEENYMARIKTSGRITNRDGPRDNRFPCQVQRVRKKDASLRKDSEIETKRISDKKTRMSNKCLGFRPIVISDDDQERERHHSSDVEILDKSSLLKVKQGNTNDYENKIARKMENKFRRQVLDEMRKPYDVKVYQRLKHDLEFKKPEERHMELRNGRERRYSFNKLGKSLLDYHPDVKKMIAAVKDDKRKCLKILRGFLFWLQKMSPVGAFHPWKDPECLAVVEEEE